MCGIAQVWLEKPIVGCFRYIKSMLFFGHQQKCCRIGDPTLLEVVVPHVYRPRGGLNLG